VSVFIEVKRTNEELETHQEQLLEYAFRQGVKIAVLTNGHMWWFYLPLFPGSWDQRKFFAIDIQEQELESAANHFMLFLSRDAIASGAAIKKAEEIRAGREKDRLIREKIPAAWRDLCQKPDEMLLELLADKVESLCGHRPGEDILAEFLVGSAQAPVPVDGPRPARRPGVNRPDTGVETPTRFVSGDAWTFKTPTGFQFKGKRYQVSSFKEILMTLAEVLYRAHGRDFEKVFALRGRRRPYFGKDYKGMTEPREIPETGVYVETCLSANAVRDRCNDLLAVLNHSPDDLQVEFRQSQAGR